MTGRERLEAILHRQPTDRLPWTTLVDSATLAGLPAELQGNDGLDFYRHLGCDIVLLNGWNTPHRLRSPQVRWAPEVTVTSERQGERTVTRWRTPRGELTGATLKGHPVKYAVDSLAAVHVYREMWDGARFEHVPGDDEAFAAIERLLGDDGIMTRFWGPSTIPRLLENDMGTENFYYLLCDHPEAMDGLIRTMHERELDAFRDLTLGAWTSVTLIENTSTYYISPAVYAQYNMPHQREFVDIVKGAGKVALLHMCGHVRNLLPLIRETGCDGIHFLTPPPTGDTPWEMALDALGEDLIILGCLDPTVFVRGPLAEIGATLDRLVTPRLRRSPFILAPTADGIPVPLERFLAVRDWVQANGGASGQREA